MDVVWTEKYIPKHADPQLNGKTGSDSISDSEQFVASLEWETIPGSNILR
jgi:hypothetical protein